MEAFRAVEVWAQRSLFSLVAPAPRLRENLSVPRVQTTRRGAVALTSACRDSIAVKPCEAKKLNPAEVAQDEIVSLREEFRTCQRHFTQRVPSSDLFKQISEAECSRKNGDLKFGMCPLLMTKLETP